MFGNLFGPKKPAQARTAPKSRKVNVSKRFTIIAETSQGSMSKVYKAVDNENGRSVCLKLQDMAKSNAAASRAARYDRPSEGEIGTKVVHPHVVRTYEYGDTVKDEHFVVMEFIDGQSLNFIRQSRPMNLPSRLEMLAQAAEGLAGIHKAGFIHRDFGPKNLLIGREDFVKVIDFGLAVPDLPAFHRPGNRTGTLQYMAPELIRREPTDSRLDIFSFAVTMFEFLTGKLPYDATDPMGMVRQRMNMDPMDPALASPTLPEPVCKLIRKLMARKKDDRWAKMATVPGAIRELI